jgi:hypothetical protein
MDTSHHEMSPEDRFLESLGPTEQTVEPPARPAPAPPAPAPPAASVPPSAPGAAPPPTPSAAPLLPPLAPLEPLAAPVPGGEPEPEPAVQGLIDSMLAELERRSPDGAAPAREQTLTALDRLAEQSPDLARAIAEPIERLRAEIKAELQAELGRDRALREREEVIARQRDVEGEVAEVVGAYALSEDEIQAAYERWNADTEADDRFSVMTFDTYCHHLYGSQAMEARRKPSGRAAAPPPPPSGPQGRIVTEAAMGSPAREGPWVPPQRPKGATMEDARRAAYARFGITP